MFTHFNSYFDSTIQRIAKPQTRWMDRHRAIAQVALCIVSRGKTNKGVGWNNTINERVTY